MNKIPLLRAVEYLRIYLSSLVAELNSKNVYTDPLFLNVY